MGEVDQSQHPEYQGVADRHQGVDGAPGQSVDRQLPEAVEQRPDVEVDVGGLGFDFEALERCDASLVADTVHTRINGECPTEFKLGV